MLCMVLQITLQVDYKKLCLLKSRYVFCCHFYGSHLRLHNRETYLEKCHIGSLSSILQITLRLYSKKVIQGLWQKNTVTPFLYVVAVEAGTKFKNIICLQKANRLLFAPLERPFPCAQICFQSLFTLLMIVLLMHNLPDFFFFYKAHNFTRLFSVCRSKQCCEQAIMAIVSSNLCDPSTSTLPYSEVCSGPFEKVFHGHKHRGGQICSLLSKGSNLFLPLQLNNTFYTNIKKYLSPPSQ